MLSHNEIKRITSLGIKKFREEHGRFTAEGHKLVSDLLQSSFRIERVYALSGWIETQGDLLRRAGVECTVVSDREMSRISGLSTPGPVLAVVKIPAGDPPASFDGFWLALDDIRDPGNLGTIIRIADWFGLSGILCSETCVDTYNPKVVQATMGSVARVPVVRTDLISVLQGLSRVSPDIQVYGAFLEGTPVWETEPPRNTVLIIGNESQGISDALGPFIRHRIMIPPFSAGGRPTAESLNASVATAILCAEFRRKHSPVPQP